jgi:hypothetical protein
MQAEVEANEDAKRKPEERAKPTANRYEATPSVDVDAETKKNLGLIESTVLGTNNPVYQAADNYIQGAKKANESAPGGFAQFTKSLGLGIAESALRPASTFEGQVGNIYDPSATAEERLGAVGNAALYGASMLPTSRGLIAGAQAVGKQGVKKAAEVGLQTFAKEALPGFVNKAIKNPAGVPVVNDLNPSALIQKPQSFEEFRAGQAQPDTIPISQAFEGYPGNQSKAPTQPSTPTNVQMGGDAVPTSARKAQVAEDRANMGLGELEDPMRKTWGSAMDEADANGYDSAWAMREAETVSTKPRALSDVETAGMTKAMAKLKNEHKALLDQATNATDPSELRAINDSLSGIESQFDTISKAVRKSGTEKGRALASQKLTINEDFDLISVRSRARASKGGELTAKEDAEIVKRVQDLEAENASQATRITELTNELVNALEVNTAKRKAGGFSRESTSAVRKQAATRFQEKVAKSSARASMLALNDATPEVIKAFREYVNAVVADGAKGLDDVVKKMADDGVSADAEDIYTALTAKTGLRKLSDLQKELAKVRRELRKDAVQGPKKAKDVVQDVPLPKTQERLKARIAELDEQIKSGEYIEAQPKKVREVDAEVYRLRAIRKMKEDRVRAIQESVRPLSGAEVTGTVLTEMKMLNPFSRITDVAANTSNLASTIVETPARIAVDRIVGAVTKQDPLMRWNFETRDRLARVMDRVKASTKAEFQRVWTGTNTVSMEKFGKSRGPGGKLAGSTDVPFRVFYREFALDLFADMKARRTLPKNASKADIADMRESFLRRIDEHPDIIDAAEEYSLHKTFNNDNLVSKSFSQIRNNVIKNEFGKVLFDETIARFSKVITNVGQDAFDRTPYGLVANGLKLAIKRGALTDVERLIITDKIAKGLYGSAFMALGYAVGDKINVEFKGDKNKYADLGDIEKLGGLSGSFLFGVTSRQAEKLKPDQAEDFKKQQITNLLTNSPAASNVQDILGGLMQPGSNKVQSVIAKKATNMVIPSAFRDIAQRMDAPNFGLTGGAAKREKVPQEENPATGRMRQTRNFWLILMNEAKSKIPVARQTLPLKGD